MSDNTYWQDGDDGVESNAVRILREKAEKDSALIREMSERLRKMEEKEKRQTVVQTITSKGLDPKVADLIPADTNPEEWLGQYGALFQPSGGSQEPAGSQAPDGVPDDEAAALAAMGLQASGAQPKVGLDTLGAQIDSATDEESLLKILRSSGL